MTAPDVLELARDIRERVDGIMDGERGNPIDGPNARFVAIESTLRNREGVPSHVPELDGPGMFYPQPAPNPYSPSVNYRVGQAMDAMERHRNAPCTIVPYLVGSDVTDDFAAHAAERDARGAWAYHTAAERFSALRQEITMDETTKTPDDRLHSDASHTAQLAQLSGHELAEALHPLSISQVRSMIVGTQDVANALREESDRLLAAAAEADRLRARLREAMHETAEIPSGPEYQVMRDRAEVGMAKPTYGEGAQAAVRS